MAEDFTSFTAPCYTVHHKGDCFTYNTSQAVDVFKLGVKYYTPMFLVLALLKKRTINRQILKSTLMNVIRTTTFIDLFQLPNANTTWFQYSREHELSNSGGTWSETFHATVLWLTLFSSESIGPGSSAITCTLTRLAGGHYPVIYLFAGFVTSLAATFIEHKSRLHEVTLYMCSVLIETLWRMAQARGHITYIPNGEVLVFSVAMAILQYFQRFNKAAMGNVGYLMQNTIGDGAEQDFEKPISKQLRVKGALVHTVAGFIKGFGLGFAAKAVHGLLFKFLKGRKDSVVEASTQLGLFLGTMIATGRGLEALLNKLKVDPRISAVISGFFSGLSSIFYPSIDIALYAFVKALDAIFRALTAAKVIPGIPYGLQLFFASIMSFEYYAVSFETNTVRKSFFNFLQTVSGGRRGQFVEWSKNIRREMNIPILNDKLAR